MAKLAQDAANAAQGTGTETAEGASQVVEQIDGAPVEPGAETATEKKLSPKNKLSRGVDPSLKTTWVPLDLPEEENRRLHKVAAVRSAASVAAGGPELKLADDILQDVLKYGLGLYKEQFDADAAKWVEPKTTSKSAKKLDEMSVEELEKHATTVQAQAQKRMDAATEMLRVAKERQAQKAAAAPAA